MTAANAIPPVDPAQLAAFLGHLAAAAEQPADAARAALRPLLGDMQPLTGRSWSEFSPRAVVALIHWSAGPERHERALDLAFRAVQADGADDVSTIVIDNGRSAAMQEVLDAVHAKRLDIAKTRLATAVARFQPYRPLTEEQAFADLLTYIDGIPDARARPSAVDGRPTVIHVGMWGERFVRAAERTILACCLAKGNIPRLAKDGTVILHLHTRASDVDLVRSLPAVQALVEHARIEISAIPERLFPQHHMWGMAIWNRLILGAVEYDSLMLARSIDADLMPLGSDQIFADGCFSAAKAKLMGGYDVVVGAPLRVTAERILEAVDAGGDRRAPALVISGERLYRLSLDAMHPFTYATFLRATPQHLAAAPHQFYFRTDDGFSARAFQLHAFAFSTRGVRADLGCDLHTIDCRIASDIVGGRDPATVCYVHREPPGDLFYVAVDAATGVSPMGDFEASPRGIAGAALYWVERPEDFDFFTWEMQQRVRYRVPPDIPLTLPTDGLDEAAAMAEVARLMEVGRAAALERIARYRR